MSRRRDIYQAIKDAVDEGRGLHLSAYEVLLLWHDQAIQQIIWTALEEQADLIDPGGET